MSNVNLYTIIAVLIYFLIIAYITYRSTRKETASDYIIGGRKVGLLGTMSSQIVSNTDGTGITIFLMFGVLYGFGTVWLYLGSAFASFLLAMQAKKIFAMVEKGKYVTVSDMFKHRIGKRSSWLSAIVVVLLSVLATAGQIYISGKLISAFFGIESDIVGMILTSVIVCSYLMIGGYKTVIKTDIFQWIAIFVIGLIAIIFGDFTVFTRIPSDMLTQIDKTFLIGLFLWGIAWSYASPYTWQRFFSAKSEKVVKKGTLLTIPFNILLGVSMVVFALTIKLLNPEIEADNLVFEIYSNPNILPVIGPLLGVTLLAMLMSSLDTYGYMTSSTIATNMIKINHENNRRKFVFTSRVITIIMFVVVTIMAVCISDFIQYMMNTASTITLLIPLYIVALFRKKKGKLLDKLVLSSFIIGAIVWVYMFATGEFSKGFLYMLIPMIISTVITVTMLLIYNYRVELDKVDTPI